MTSLGHTESPPQSATRPGRIVRAVVIGWLVLVLSATLYEGAIALRLIELGQVPGAEPAPRGVLFLLTIAALLGGGIVLCVAGIAGAVRDATDPSSGGGIRMLGLPELSLVPLSAAAFFIAHYFSYDAYYAPSLRRVSTDIPAALVIVIGCWAVLAAIGLRIRWVTRPAAIATGLLLLVVWIGLIAGGSH